MTEVEEISVAHMSELSISGQEDINRKVESKPQTFRYNFKGFVQVTKIAESPIRIEQQKSNISKGTNMIEAKAGNVYVTMPKDAKSIEIAKKLIDILSMQIDEETKKTKGA